ncbi:MAG: hypothetical protein QXJ68_07865 [Methanocellales archaeon]
MGEESKEGLYLFSMLAERELRLLQLIAQALQLLDQRYQGGAFQLSHPLIDLTVRGNPYKKFIEKGFLQS